MNATIYPADGPCSAAPSEGTCASNPYRRDAWSQPPTSRRAARAVPTPRPTTSAARASAPARSAGRIGGMRAVRLVAATGFAVFALIAAFQLAGMYAEGLGAAPVVAATGAAVPAPTAAGDGAEAVSTPRDQWRAGEIPFLYQIDPHYSAAPYAGADVEESGCGPTSLAMVYIALTGKTDLDPAAMAAFSEEGGYVEGGLTAWRLMTEGAADLGLSSHEVPADASRLVAELQAGRPVICSVRPGDFTDTGHFLVVAGVADNGELVIHDPNSPANSARTWDVQRVLSQCANLWAFERA